MTGRSQASAGDLLELVRSGRATTRGALQQATGLSRATVGQRLDRLFRAGWLREGAGGPVDSPLGGRPSITLEFDESAANETLTEIEIRQGKRIPPKRATNGDPWWGDSAWKTPRNNNTVSPESLGTSPGK